MAHAGSRRRSLVLMGCLFASAVCLLATSSLHAQPLLFTLDSPNPQANVGFGWKVALGDVNGDGETDIVVGAHAEDVGSNPNQGRVYVFSGANGSLLLTLDSPNPQPHSHFSESMAVGDVNGDGKADIAVGAYWEDVGDNIDQGRVYVFSGGDGSLLFTLDTPNPRELPRFGKSAAVGDVNGDGKADIAVGAYEEDVGVNPNQGRVYVFSGADGSLLFTLDTPNPQPNARFGVSVAVGDVNGDGNKDITVGELTGRVYVFSGASESPLFTFHTPRPLEYTFFGVPVAVGDVNGDGKGDIVVGAYDEDVGDNVNQGRAYVFSGADGSLLFALDIPHPLDPEPNVGFGVSVALGNVNDDGKADIAVGAWLEDVDGNGGQGRAYVFSGADSSPLLTLDTPNPEPTAFFGVAVAVSNVDGDSGKDIAIGASGENTNGNADQGRAYVFSLCLPGLDTDLDGFDDDIECYVGTDSLNACPDDPSHDAWPPDINVDTVVDTFDAFLFLAAFPSAQGGPNYSQRLDMKLSDGVIDIFDALTFLNHFPSACTNP